MRLTARSTKREKLDEWLKKTLFSAKIHKEYISCNYWAEDDIRKAIERHQISQATINLMARSDCEELIKLALPNVNDETLKVIACTDQYDSLRKLPDNKFQLVIDILLERVRINESVIHRIFDIRGLKEIYDKYKKKEDVCRAILTYNEDKIPMDIYLEILNTAMPKEPPTWWASYLKTLIEKKAVKIIQQAGIPKIQEAT
jgi:hypothetical protein